MKYPFNQISKHDQVYSLEKNCCISFKGRAGRLTLISSYGIKSWFWGTLRFKLKNAFIFDWLNVTYFYNKNIWKTDF